MATAARRGHLAKEAGADATQLSVQEAAVFHPGDIIVVH